MVNLCAGDLVTEVWPGSADVATVDTAGTLGGNMSGLAYEAVAGGALVLTNPGAGNVTLLARDRIAPGR